MSVDPYDTNLRLAEARYLASLEGLFPEAEPDEGPDPDEEYGRRRDREELHGPECPCANCRWLRGKA